MGTVYEAVDERLDTTVALKETFFADERLRKQFEREARLLARLHHPALPRVSDHFSEGDGQFLVMQYIPGEDLSEMMAKRKGPFPADQVLTWADQLLDALDYLHTQEPQIVHRDIKPQNLKLTARGQIILLDFGLAKGQAGDISRVTTSASIFGYTPNYAPLEQIQGLGTDSRSDIYALAATIYHLLTGTKPPDALTRATALVNGEPDPLVPATQANPTIASEVSDVLQQALAQGRDQRFTSAAEMRKALHRTEQTSTIVNRGEADTVLLPPSAKTAVATQVVDKQATVAAGETTVVRPLVANPSKKILPWALSAALLVLVGGSVLGFFLIKQSRTEAVHSVTVTPSPEASPSATTQQALTSQTPVPTATAETKPATTEQQTAKKNERGRTEEPKATPAPTAPPVTKTESSGHQGSGSNEPPREPGAVPTPPDRVNRGNRPRNLPNTRVLPGGVVIRNFPDGSQMISSPDGTRVLVTPDGRRQVLKPGQRPNRQPTPEP